MRVLALDPSLTCMGWALNGELRHEYGTYAPRYKGVQRLQDALNWLLPVARGEAVGRIPPGPPFEMVMIEGYSFDSRHQGHHLGEMGGVLRLGLHQLGLDVVEVPPSCMKKVATGAGNARKDMVLAEAIRRLEYEGSDHNAADALWLLAMALVQYRLPGAPLLPEKHLEGMRKIEWPEMAALRRTA